LNEQQVRYLLIGGMNFLLRHKPELTYDVDIWVADDEENRTRTNRALREMAAEWGRTDNDWDLVPEDASWLSRQGVYCLTSKFGAIDIFREVRGLEGKFEECFSRAIPEETGSGVRYHGLADIDMLRCQEVLPEGQQKRSRVEVLRAAVKRHE
jgi:hypothetical protein